MSIETIEMDEEALARNFADAAYHNEHHHFDLNTVGKFALSTLPRKSGVPVVITGEGSDELFGGYPFLLADSFVDADLAMPHTPLAQDNELRVMIQQLMTSGMGDIIAAKGFFADSRDADWPGRDCTVGSRLHLSAYPGPSSGVFAPWIAEEALKAGVLGKKPEHGPGTGMTAEVARKKRDEWHSLHGALYAYVKGPLANKILTCLGDRCEMAHSIEARPPFLDHKLAEYVAGLPPSVKVSFCPRRQDNDDEADGGPPAAKQSSWWGSLLEGLSEDQGQKLAGWELTEKWILREATRPFITRELYERRKHPYSAPLAWPRGGPIHVMLGKLLTDEAVATLGFVDPGAVKRALEMGFGDQADARSFRTLLIVASWVVIGQRFGVKTARREDWSRLGVAAEGVSGA